VGRISPASDDMGTEGRVTQEQLPRKPNAKDPVVISIALRVAGSQEISSFGA